MVASKYGFGDVTSHPGIALAPSRIAAQIVTGVSFHGLLPPAAAGLVVRSGLSLQRSFSIYQK